MSVADLGEHPLFMRSLPTDNDPESADSATLAAIQALVYDGEPTGTLSPLPALQSVRPGVAGLPTAEILGDASAGAPHALARRKADLGLIVMQTWLMG